MKTIGEIRRENMLAAQQILGGVKILSDKANVSKGYQSQIKNRAPDSRTGTPMQMGDKVARRIEIAINKSVGWMDQDHSNPEQDVTVVDAPLLPVSCAPGRKELSDDDKQAADRLRGLWARYKQQHGLSQEEIAERLGVTQGAFGQYINAIVPLNLEMALKMAAVFGVPVSFIKRFDSLEGYFNKFGLHEMPDKHTNAIVDSMSKLDSEEKARIRGVVEGCIMEIINKKTVEKD